MVDEQFCGARELSGQLLVCPSEEVEPLLEKMCVALFGPQTTRRTLGDAKQSRLVMLMLRCSVKGKLQVPEELLLQTVILFKCLLCGITHQRYGTKTLVKRLDETLLPSVFLKTAVRPAHLRVALHVSHEFIATVASSSVVQVLHEWKTANQWDFLPPTRGVVASPSHLLGVEKESNTVAGAGGVSSSSLVSHKGDRTSLLTGASDGGVRSHPKLVSAPLTRGIPSYLITKRGVRASTPPPAQLPPVGQPFENEPGTHPRAPVYASQLPAPKEDSNSTLVLESPVKRRRMDHSVVPPSPKRD